MAYRCLLIDHDDTMLSTFDLRAKITAVAIAEVFGEEVDGAAYSRPTTVYAWRKWPSNTRTMSP